MTLGTVTGLSPLVVRTDGATVSLPAKVAGGVSLTPTTGQRVLVAQVAGRLYLMGSA